MGTKAFLQQIYCTDREVHSIEIVSYQLQTCSAMLGCSSGHALAISVLRKDQRDGVRPALVKPHRLKQADEDGVSSVLSAQYTWVWHNGLS